MGGWVVTHRLGFAERENVDREIHVFNFWSAVFVSVSIPVRKYLFQKSVTDE